MEKEEKCLECGIDISNRRWNAKRCESCQRKRHLLNMKKYRNKNKNKIKEYQKIYYIKEENKKR